MVSLPIPAAAEKNPGTAFVRPIRVDDDTGVAMVIRTVLTEHGCVAEGFAIHDPEVDKMYETYVHHDARSAYFVLEDNGVVVGGCGIAPLRGTYQNIAELQKFYIMPGYRGLGFGKQLLESCLAFAREKGFSRCYIETVSKMNQAEKLYLKSGFESLGMPLGNTGHHACDRWYVKVLV